MNDRYVATASFTASWKRCAMQAAPPPLPSRELARYATSRHLAQTLPTLRPRRRHTRRIQGRYTDTRCTRSRSTCLVRRREENSHPLGICVSWLQGHGSDLLLCRETIKAIVILKGDIKIGCTKGQTNWHAVVSIIQRPHQTERYDTGRHGA